MWPGRDWCGCSQLIRQHDPTDAASFWRSRDQTERWRRRLQPRESSAGGNGGCRHARRDRLSEVTSTCRGGPPRAARYSIVPLDRLRQVQVQPVRQVSPGSTRTGSRCWCPRSTAGTTCGGDTGCTHQMKRSCLKSVPNRSGVGQERRDVVRVIRSPPCTELVPA